MKDWSFNTIVAITGTIDDNKRRTRLNLLKMKRYELLSCWSELDLVELEDQLSHQVYKIDPEIAVDIFKMDPNFLNNENKYQDFKKKIHGDESEEEEEEEGCQDSDD
ncbi:hypothetical protein L2E82_02027 [Cichorium intybus]|uniref:Uncharacterized protein n=1 Tax=Cichorium intybus TaxID=13427 RepID=A0ACB9H1L5_CICIN|nr:hypothetical protein L2E82_02027 [Cichorium intybus]